MDLSCIISSGDLELYVLGLLPPEEAYQIEQLALLLPEIRSELDSISQSLEDLAVRAAANPSPAVKERLMAQLQALKAADTNTTGNNSTITTPAPPFAKTTEAPVVPMATRKSEKAPLLAAAVIGLLFGIGGVIYFALQNRQNAQQVAGLQQEVQSLRKESTEQQQQLQAYYQALQLWQSNDYRKINLTQVPGKPEALAQVFWNEKTREVFLSNVSLPPAPSGRQYQLWAIVEGKPVNAGLLSDTTTHIQKMNAFASAEAFAITLEKAGGSEVPTLEEMYVLGKPS